MARRSAATASFSALRCVRVRVSTCLGKCEIFGRRGPTFRSFGFAYGFILLRITLVRAVRTGEIARPGCNTAAEGKTLVDTNTWID
jgi:hypothetical protein